MSGTKAIRVYADTSVYGGCFDSEFEQASRQSVGGIWRDPHLLSSGGYRHMNGRGEFDCVQMKRDIQQRLASEFQGMSSEETQRAQQQRIAADPLLGPFLQKVTVSVPPLASHR
jgi:hypothetical protein